MYSIICSKDYRSQIRSALGDVIILAEKVGIFDEFEIENAVQEVARAYSAILIVDITCHPYFTLVSALRKYKIARRDARIIIVAPGCEPGNKTISGLVKCGIWDIVATPPFQIEEDNQEQYAPKLHNITNLLADMLKKPKNDYVDASRWDVFEDTVIESKKWRGSGQNSKLFYAPDRIIEKPLGTITIAVSGTTHGAGATHTAISIAQFLAKRYGNIAFVELNSSKHILVLKQDEYKKGKLVNSFVINGIDFYSYCSCDLFDIIQADYKYIILDIGLAKEIKYSFKATQNIKIGSTIKPDALEITGNNSIVKSEYYNEFLRADCKILVTGLMEWQIDNLIKILNNDEDYSKWHFYITNSDDAMMHDFKKITKYENVYQAPYSPDPFLVNKELDQIFPLLLKEVIPTEKVVKKGFFKNLFK